MDLLRRNSADTVNPNVVNGKTVSIHQTVRGSDFYFAICAVMGFVSLSILGASRMKPRTDRVFFYLSSGLCMVACIAYFSMGSNLGWTPIDVEWLRPDPEVHGRNRQVFYARYIDVSKRIWTEGELKLTTPAPVVHYYTNALDRSDAHCRIPMANDNVDDPR